MSGREFPTVASQVTSVQFLAAMRAALPESTPSMRAVLTAQVFLETGRLHYCNNFNLGNFKAGSDQDHCYFTTKERLPLAQALHDVMRSTPEAPCKMVGHDGDRATVLYSPRHPTARFRSYETLDAGMVDYVALLRTKWNKAWSCAEAGDPVRFVHALKAAGYFTADEGAYAKAVSSIFREVLPIA